MPAESYDAGFRSLLGPWQSCPGELRLRCAFAQATSGRRRRPLLARPGEEVLLLVELQPGRHSAACAHELTVELLRGERRRDTWRQRLGPDGLCCAFRVPWGATGSSRLIGRLLVDGREMARATLLLGAPLADAQGRFTPGAAEAPASAATLLAFADQLREQVAERPPRDGEG